MFRVYTYMQYHFEATQWFVSFLFRPSIHSALTPYIVGAACRFSISLPSIFALFAAHKMVPIEIDTECWMGKRRVCEQEHRMSWSDCEYERDPSTFSYMHTKYHTNATIWFVARCCHCIAIHTDAHSNTVPIRLAWCGIWIEYMWTKTIERATGTAEKMIRVYIIYDRECVRCQNGFYIRTRCMRPLPSSVPLSPCMVFLHWPFVFRTLCQPANILAVQWRARVCVCRFFAAITKLLPILMGRCAAIKYAICAIIFGRS